MPRRMFGRLAAVLAMGDKDAAVRIRALGIAQNRLRKGEWLTHQPLQRVTSFRRNELGRGRPNLTVILC